MGKPVVVVSGDIAFSGSKEEYAIALPKLQAVKAEVRGLIRAAREQVARAVNSGLVSLYWHIGRRVHQDILKEKRAEYGEDEMCRIERWSVRTLRQKIGGMLCERTALSKKPNKLIRQELAALREEDKLTPDLVFRDPYVLELGVGFAFLERQKRITVDGEDHYLDLLFYHRHLRRLVAIDLKLEEFKPGDKGQMEFYLRWLDRQTVDVVHQTRSNRALRDWRGPFAPEFVA